MKRLLISIALLLISNVVMAEWKTVVEDAEGNIIFVDPATKKRTGEIVRIGVLTNYAKAQVNNDIAYRSHKEVSEIDCKNDRLRQLHQTIFAGLNGAGRVVAEIPQASDWLQIEPGWMAWYLMAYVCAK